MVKNIAIALTLVGWFYATKAALPEYPGAFTISIDGPFESKAQCESARRNYVEFLEAFGALDKIQIKPCFEKKES